MLLSALWCEEEKIKVKGMEMSTGMHWGKKIFSVFSFYFNRVNLSYYKIIFWQLSKFLGLDCKIIYVTWTFLHLGDPEIIFTKSPKHKIRKYFP